MQLASYVINKAPFECLLISGGLILAGITLHEGVHLPVLKMETGVPFLGWTLFSETNITSIVETIETLENEGKDTLAMIIWLFSVVFPTAKTTVMGGLWLFPLRSKYRKFILTLLHVFGKWSMLDVMVVAVLVVLLKSDSKADATPMIGIYVFGTHVILSMLLAMRLGKQEELMTKDYPSQYRKPEDGNPPPIQTVWYFRGVDLESGERFKFHLARKNFEKHGGGMIIGRSKSCDLRLPSDSVSRQHAELFYSQDELCIRDLGSLNGTKHNQAPLAPHEPTRLKNGDTLDVAKVSLTVKLEPIH